MSADGHDLLLAFDTDDPAFARGFEAGCLWARLRLADDNEEVEALVHSSNAEMLMRMAEATGRRAAAEVLSDTWVSATLAPGEYVESAP